MLSKQPPAKPSLIAWMPNLQDMDCLKVCIPTMAHISLSKEIEDYLNEMGIEHHYTTHLWPRANGEVEKQNRSLLKSMRAAHREGKNWRGDKQVTFGVQVHATFKYRKKSCRVIV